MPPSAIIGAAVPRIDGPSRPPAKPCTPPTTTSRTWSTPCRFAPPSPTEDPFASTAARQRRCRRFSCCITAISAPLPQRLRRPQQREPPALRGRNRLLLGSVRRRWPSPRPLSRPRPPPPLFDVDYDAAEVQRRHLARRLPATRWRTRRSSRLQPSRRLRRRLRHRPRPDRRDLRHAGRNP